MQSLCHSSQEQSHSSIDLIIIMASFLKSFLAPQAPTAPSVTEISVRRKLKGSLNESVTSFTGGELRVLSRILERAERNPIDTEPFLTPTDLSKLSLSVSDDDHDGKPDKGGNGNGLEGVFGEGDGEEDYGTSIPVTAALTTPDNTPSGSEPIPAPVLASMKVLQASPEAFGEPATPEALKAKMNGAPAPAFDHAADAKAKVSSMFEPAEEEAPLNPPSNEILQAFESATPTNAISILKTMKNMRPKVDPVYNKKSRLNEDLSPELARKIRSLGVTPEL